VGFRNRKRTSFPYPLGGRDRQAPLSLFLWRELGGVGLEELGDGTFELRQSLVDLDHLI
jgi:hypothetical protein